MCYTSHVIVGIKVQGLIRLTHKRRKEVGFKQIALEFSLTIDVRMFTFGSKRSKLRQPKQDWGIDAIRLILKKRSMHGNPQD